MNAETNKVERVIGFDSHPDTFTAVILQGRTPAAAVVQKTFNKLPAIASTSFEFWPRSIARPWFWKALIWASSKKPTLTMTSSAR